MKRSIRWRPFIPVTCVFLLMFLSLNAGALSGWTEREEDFRNGERISTELANGRLALQKGDPIPPNWTEMGNEEQSRGLTGELVYDSFDDRFIAFGGRPTPYVGEYETWEYNLTSNAWTKLNPPTIPSNLNPWHMTYDYNRNQIILIQYYGKTSEIWIYDVTGNEWTVHQSPTAPEYLSYFTLATDSKNDVLYLFGADSYGAHYYTQTWIYYINNTTWIRIYPSNCPTFDEEPGMVYDARNKVAVLFSGDMDEGPTTWIFNPVTNAWKTMSPATSPSKRMWFGMTYETINAEVVLFGGYGGEHFRDLNDTWTYNVSADNWTKQDTLRAPSPRTNPMIAFDTNMGCVLLIGGDGGVDYNGPSWTFSPKNDEWVPRSTRPYPRGSHAMAYDSGNDLSVLFGGYWGITAGGTQSINETWTYSSADDLWTKKEPVVSPPPRLLHSLSYDRDSGLVVLFSGLFIMGETVYSEPDTWTYDPLINLWMKKNPSSYPSSRWEYSMVYDEQNMVHLLFGGHSGPGSHDLQSGDTWIYNLTNDSWQQVDIPISPAPRYGHAMAYDSGHGCAVLFGGRNESGYLFGGTWVFNSSTFTWTEMDTPTQPSPRSGHSLVYDSTAGRAILYGGTSEEGCMNDMWAYDPSNSSWTNITVAEGPSNRMHHSMSYVESMDSLLLFGGESDQFLGDTWTFSGNQYRSNGTYTSRALDCGGEAYFGTIGWNAVRPAGTGMRVQFRSAGTQETLNVTQFTGPDGTPTSFYDSDAHRINEINNGSHWFQYRAYLNTSNPRTTPLLSSVAVSYNLIHRLHLIFPIGGENWSEMAQIMWSVLDPDSDSISIDIYLETDNSSTQLFGGLPADSNTTYWNTNDTPNGTYRIRIVARDDNPSIPLSVTEVSENFTIFHPPPKPPNRPPQVALISPENGSVINTTSVRLLWNGTDPDGDLLNYNVHYSDLPFTERVGQFVPTTQQLMDLSDLNDGATYYWTVDAGDGFNHTAEDPAPVWHFTVVLPKPPPPVNHPPKLTSTPILVLKVNESWTYRILASDEDGDSLSISLSAIPEGMILDSANGTLSWTPRAGQEGNHTITISVSDGKGGLDSQTFALTVAGIPPPPEFPPFCVIDRPGNGSVVKGALEVAGRAFNGSLPLGAVHFRIDGGNWQTARGLSNWSFTIDTHMLRNGPHTLEARSYDGVRFSNTTAIKVNVQNPPESVTAGNQYCQPALILASILGLVFVMSLAFRKKKDQA